MKYDKCPKCGSTDLGDMWCKDRKLMQYCCEVADECGWEGKPRTPEQLEITDKKKVCVDDFSGWDYILYDQYGHGFLYSQTFNCKSDAIESMEDVMIRHNNPPVGPCTGVLFHTPSMITITGKMFEVKDMKMLKKNV